MMETNSLVIDKSVMLPFSLGFLFGKVMSASVDCQA